MFLLKKYVGQCVLAPYSGAQPISCKMLLMLARFLTGRGLLITSLNSDYRLVDEGIQLTVVRLRRYHI